MLIFTLICSGLEEVAEPEAAQENIQRLYSESASEEIEASGVGETDGIT